jgi:lipid kinase YegS
MATARTVDLVIHGSRADRPALRAAVDWARAVGHRVRARVTWEAGDARRHAADAVRAGTDIVVAVGGDGTLNAVINGVLLEGRGGDVAVGVLPLGTANDFARQIGMPDDPREGMPLLFEHEARPMDAGLLNGRAFLNVSSAGIGAEATAETSALAKGVFGVLAYAFTGARKLASDGPPRRAHFSGPELSREFEYLAFAVGNARSTGAGVEVAPRAQVDDGLLDLCIVEPVAPGEVGGLLLGLRRGEHLDRDGVHYWQTPWLRVESEVPVAVNVDGEAVSLTQLNYGVARAALRVIAPCDPSPPCE